jgi:hypothetical protein
MHLWKSLPVILLATLLWPARSDASFHEWEIDQVDSNASGSIQYVSFVLHNPTDDEKFISLSTLQAGLNSNSMGFTNLPSTPVDGSHFLVATPGFAAIAGVTPDFEFPVTPFFNPAGDTVSLQPAIDSLTFGPFVEDGILAATFAGMVLNSPTNFAGDVGFVPEPGTNALMLAGAIGILAVARSSRRLLS